MYEILPHNDAPSVIFLCFYCFQIPQDFEMYAKKTHIAGLEFWGWTRFIVLEFGAVIWGKASKTEQPKFHFYRGSAECLEKTETHPALCEHVDDSHFDHKVNINIISMQVQGKEKVVVSCPQCHMIRLLDVKNKDVTVALHLEGLVPCTMSHGSSPAELYLLHLGGQYVQLDCSSEQFSIKSAFKTHTNTFYDICYIPRHNLIVSSTRESVQAASCDTDEMAWEFRGEVDGEECQCHGCVYSPQLDALLIADGYKTRILVLNAADGTLRQAVPFQVEMGTVSQLCLQGGYLVVRHFVADEQMISYFSLLSHKDKQVVLYD